MPRYSQPYSEFVARLREITLLIRLAKDLSMEPPTGPNVASINAICRGGVVLLSSHVEGYVEGLADIAVQRLTERGAPKSTVALVFRYYLSREIIGAIRTSKEPAKIASCVDKLLKRDAHVWDENEPFKAPVDAKGLTSDFANPSFKKIKRFFNRFGFSAYETELSRELGAEYVPCTNMISQVVLQRNLIAHGDSVTTGTPSDLAEMAALAKVFCRATDVVFCNWFRDKGCPIR